MRDFFFGARLINSPMSVTVWTGPMFAQKTTALVGAVARRRAAGDVVHVVKHAGDERYAAAGGVELVTHDGRRLAVDSAAARLADVEVGDAAAVAVDEGQFFPDLVAACERWADQGRDVYVATLLSDYHREPFPEPARLLAKADAVHFGTATCTDCGADASFTFYTGPRAATQEGFVVGGADLYRPRCRACFRRADAADHAGAAPRDG